MTVLARSELKASPLADLHAIADQLGVEGFRRLRKADLIDAILVSQGVDISQEAQEPDAAEADAEPAAADAEDLDGDAEERPARTRRRRAPRLRRGAAARADGDAEGEEGEREPEPQQDAAEAPAARNGAAGRARGSARGSARGAASARGARAERAEEAPEEAERIAEGVVEVLGNGSAFLRVQPPGPSDEDVYISAAQVRRCELVSGDRVTGPVRTPRRSERYPSLVRIDTINGSSADAVAGAARFEDLPAVWPSERLALDAADKTLEAIEWLTPLGRGSRAVIVGTHFAGKSRTLRSIARALSGRDGLELSIVLVGVRPEEIADWHDDGLEPAAAVSLAATADSQAQALERALEPARRAAARGADAVLLLDTLDGLPAQAARKALAAARNLREAGSLTVIATATRPLGGETTVIALDASLTSSGREPILDLAQSGSLRPELLVGDDGAEAITKARAAAFEAV